MISAKVFWDSLDDESIAREDEILYREVEILTARRSHEIWSLRVVLGDPGFEASALSSCEWVIARSAENRRSCKCLEISLKLL